VALVPDEGSRSKDIIASGVVQRVASPPGLDERMAHQTPFERACLLAENGVWYDALSLLSELTALSPGNTALRDARADFLASVGLKEASEASRK
jgi:hypothetical protein